MVAIWMFLCTHNHLLPPLCLHSLSPCLLVCLQPWICGSWHRFSMQTIHSIVDPVGCGMAQLLAQLSHLVQSQRAYTAATVPIYGSSLRFTQSAPQLVMSTLSGGDMAITSIQQSTSLPVLLRLASCAPCACICLRGTVLHSLPMDVQHWLQQLRQQHRLQVIVGHSLPSKSSSTRHLSTWLCIFNCAASHRLLVLPHQQTSTSLSVVCPD